MPITSLFNETELAIFRKQCNFEFRDYKQCEDGTIYALDYMSGQVFIGRDLVRGNVHKLSDILSVTEENGAVNVTFKDARKACFAAGTDSAGAIVIELRNYIQTDETEDYDENEFQEVLDTCQTDKALRETYSRLINTGRSKAIAYLVSEVGMSVKSASKYVDEIEIMDATGETGNIPKINDPGRMSEEDIFAVVKQLKSGDRIHLEYKPFVGKLRVYDAEFTDLVISADSRGDSIYLRAGDYSSLMEDLSEKMFGYMSLWFLCPDNGSEINIRLDKLRVLRKL